MNKYDNILNKFTPDERDTYDNYYRRVLDSQVYTTDGYSTNTVKPFSYANSTILSSPYSMGGFESNERNDYFKRENLHTLDPVIFNDPINKANDDRNGGDRNYAGRYSATLYSDNLHKREEPAINIFKPKEYEYEGNGYEKKSSSVNRTPTRGILKQAGSSSAKKHHRRITIDETPHTQEIDYSKKIMTNNYLNLPETNSYKPSYTKDTVYSPYTESDILTTLKSNLSSERKGDESSDGGYLSKYSSGIIKRTPNKDTNDKEEEFMRFTNNFKTALDDKYNKYLDNIKKKESSYKNSGITDFADEFYRPIGQVEVKVKPTRSHLTNGEAQQSQYSHGEKEKNTDYTRNRPSSALNSIKDDYGKSRPTEIHKSAEREFKRYQTGELFKKPLEKDEGKISVKRRSNPRPTSAAPKQISQSIKQGFKEGKQPFKANTRSMNTHGENINPRGGKKSGDKIIAVLQHIIEHIRKCPNLGEELDNMLS